MKIFLAIILFSICFRGFSQTDFQIKSTIDSMVTSHMSAEKAVGISIGVVKDGKIFYTKGYGTKEIGTDQPIDSMTNFHLASISKVFVATGIMQLVEREKIKLDDKLIYYVLDSRLFDNYPDNAFKDRRFKNITIRQMLMHTSGFPDIDDVKGYNWDKPNNDPSALKNYSQKSVLSSQLLFEPGSDWMYSNMAFESLGYVIEARTSILFDQYEYENILQKTGMTNSSFDYTKIPLERRSKPHGKKKETVAVLKTYPYNREHSPSSTLNSCSYDMCKWIIEMLTIYNDKNNTYDGVLKRETLLRMWDVNYRLSDQSYYMGLGWLGQYSPLGVCMTHSGLDPGYGSNLFIYPQHNLGIIILVNADYCSENLLGKLPLEIALLLKEK